jgi:hypothetical protein
MSGRGDNNKNGSAGRGSSNQSSQAFGQTANRGKSNHGDQTGGRPSVPEKKTKDQTSDRNTSLDKEVK